MGPASTSLGSWLRYPSARFFALLALLVAIFLCVPLVQGFNLEAGQDLTGKSEGSRAADRAAAAEVERLLAAG